MADQELYWLSAKTSFSLGKGKFITKGDRIDGRIPAERLPQFKESGEVGAIASPANVEIDEAYEKQSIELEALKEKSKAILEKMAEYDMVFDSVIEALGADVLKKEIKLGLIQDLEALK